jgi:hypothetical protein
VQLPDFFNKIGHKQTNGPGPKSEFVRYAPNSDHYDPSKNEPRLTHCNAIDDRALPIHGNASVAFRAAPMIGSY